MSNYVRSVRSLTAELRPLVKPAVDKPAPAAVVEAVAVAEVAAEATAPQPIAVVGVHGISPIQQYAFQDQLATGLLAYLNARDDLALGVEYADRRVAAVTVPHERRSGRERRVRTETRAKGERRRVKTRWAATPYWPRVTARSEDPVLKPSALRLHRRTEADPTKPTGQVYDVYEGYWSPLSKGKSNLASMMAWLLRVTFLATSSTANLPATWGKLMWDLGYVFVALGIVLGLFAGGVREGAKAWTSFLALFLPHSPPSFWDFAANPFANLKLLPWYAWLHLAAIVVLAYLFVQLAKLVWSRVQGWRSRRELLQDSGDDGHFRGQTVLARKFHSILTGVFIVAFVLLFVADVVMLRKHHPANWPDVMREGGLLLAAVALVQVGRWLADFVAENILGDVQVYSTHDCNNTFYTIRQQIIAAVTNAVLGAVTAVRVELDKDDEPKVRRDVNNNPLPDPPLYGKIHIAGHSLGSTIAMDVLLRIRQLSYEGAITENAWSRVRSLTTFGTALEKTRYLLDVRNPTVSAAQQQWQNDTYGRFFTLDRATLDEDDNSNGIYWENLWYFHDVVANEIVSYKSDARPGSFAWTNDERDICANTEIPHPRWPGAFVHGDYIGDALFWKSVGPTLTYT